MPAAPCKERILIEMNYLFADIKTAAKAFGEVRKARKNGADKVEIKAQPLRVLPIINTVGFYNTVEGCTLSHCEKEIVDIAQKAFNELPYEERHRLMFAPENGEFVERAIFWRTLLEPVMSKQQTGKAMQQIVHWYIHIKRDLSVIRAIKSIEYPLYPDMPENTIMSKHDNMHKALIDKMYDDMCVISDYRKIAGSKVAHDFIHSNSRGILVNLWLWFRTSEEWCNQLVTYGKYKRVREDLDLCLYRLRIEQTGKKGGATHV